MASVQQTRRSPFRPDASTDTKRGTQRHSRICRHLAWHTQITCAKHWTAAVSSACTDCRNHIAPLWASANTPLYNYYSAPSPHPGALSCASRNSNRYCICQPAVLTFVETLAATSLARGRYTYSHNAIYNLPYIIYIYIHMHTNRVHNYKPVHKMTKHTNMYIFVYEHFT